jgi:dihydroanticapsin dehydrogenase
MALDHAQDNIRVNCVCPAIVETEMALFSLSKARDPEATRKQRIAELPLGRFGKPEDIALMALYLASDESSWVTGTVIPIDGGQTAS